jgi:hypothetical protein
MHKFLLLKSVGWNCKSDRFYLCKAMFIVTLDTPTLFLCKVYTKHEYIVLAIKNIIQMIMHYSHKNISLLMTLL